MAMKAWIEDINNLASEIEEQIATKNQKAPPQIEITKVQQQSSMKKSSAGSFSERSKVVKMPN